MIYKMEQEKAGNSPMLSSTHSIVFQLKNGEIILNRTERCPPPLHFRKYIKSMGWSLISTALTLNQLFKSSILELDNKTENYYNYNGAEYPMQLVSTIFYFLLKYQNRAVNKRKRKGKIERMTRRRIKSEFVSINCIQFIRLKIQK